MPPAIAPGPQVRRARSGRRATTWSAPRRSRARASVAFTTISLANSMPVVRRPSAEMLAPNPRIPQWKSPLGLRKNSRPKLVSTGLPR